MINYVNGNILDGIEKIIVQSVNHQGVMGAGLAKQIATKYPEILNDDRMYKEMCRDFSFESIKRQGLVAWHNTGDGKFIASVFGQDRYGRGGRLTDYVSLGNGLETVRELASDKNYSVSIPFGIGCGLGGGNWEVVLGIITDCFKYSTEVNVFIYNLK